MKEREAANTRRLLGRTGGVAGLLRAALVVVPALSGGCSASLEAPRLVSELTGGALGEERLLRSTCEVLRLEDESDLAGLASRAIKPVRDHLLGETTAVLDGAFSALGVGDRCHGSDVVGAQLARRPAPDGCAEAFGQALGRAGTNALAGALRVELSAGGDAAGAGAPSLGLDATTLAALARRFLERPGYWAARLDVAPALLEGALVVADNAERLVDDLVGALPYLAGMLRPLARQATAEIVAFAFERAIDVLARTRLVGAASLARSACRALDAGPRGAVATRLLHRTVLRFEPGQWRTYMEGSPLPVEATTWAAWQGVGPARAYPLAAACRTLAAARSGKDAFFGRATPCAAAWAAVGDGSAWRDEVLVPSLATAASPSPETAAAVGHALGAASDRCAKLGGCTLRELLLLASHVTLGAPGDALTLADLRAALGETDASHALGARLDELERLIAETQRERARAESELLGYVKRFGACDEVNRRARAHRFAVLAATSGDGDLCDEPSLADGCAEVRKASRDGKLPPREVLTGPLAPTRAAVERFCAAPVPMARSVARVTQGTRSAELVVDEAALCALDATALSLRGRGALFDVAASGADGDTRATLGLLRERLESVVRGLDPSGERDFSVAVTVDGTVSEEGARTMPDQRALAIGRARTVAALLGASTAPAGRLHFAYAAGDAPDLSAVEEARRDGLGPCAKRFAVGTPDRARCIEEHRGVRFGLRLPEEWYPCPRVEAPR